MKNSFLKNDFCSIHIYVYFLLLPFFLTSCATHEQIETQQKVTQISEHIHQSQEINAQTLAKVQALEEMVLNLNSKVVNGDQFPTQNQSKEKESSQGPLNLYSQHQRLLTLAHKEDQTQIHIQFLQDKIQNQGEILNEILKVLKTLGSNQNVKKLTQQDSYQEAMEQFQKKNYSQAKKLLTQLLKNKSIKGNRSALINHRLGLIEYFEKQFENAIILFSRVYTEFPKSSEAPSALLYLAKTFEQKRMKSEAVEALKELIKNFPKSSEVSEAKKVLNSLE